MERQMGSAPSLEPLQIIERDLLRSLHRPDDTRATRAAGEQAISILRDALWSA